MSKSDIHYLGIRHHGPGSAKRLIAALDTLRPSQLLIEGPADCSELMSMLADSGMQPPVALLAYATDNPEHSIYYPFAEFSPEYQACCWAVRHQAELHFIDIPAGIQLAGSRSDEATENDEPTAPSNDNQQQLFEDPIAVLARLSGYQDSEAWWNDLIEQNHDDDLAIFDTVAQAMAALRESITEEHPSHSRDLVREAYMRREISRLSKNTEGPTVVVCGAWHIPALQARHSSKDDRALIATLAKKLPASKLKSTWIPWTSPRLALRSGYGAGVASPMWYQHLWDQRDNSQALEHWLTRVTQALRNSGQVISSASVIEAVRLSHSLAAVRNRPSPGFEEIREAVIACLCFGEPLIWNQLETQLLLGHAVGSIPEHAPLAPLLEDLQKQQKRHKLKAEALDRELSLDLRSEAGLGKSILLHRLNILNVPWGKITDAGGSRGTFRERWQLSWQPEFAVQLVENLVYGSTIEQAAGNRLSEVLASEHNLTQLAETTQLALEAQLNSAAETGLAQLDQRAAHTSDALELLESIAPLVQIHRYGSARELSFQHVGKLIDRLATQSALALPYACRNLNDDEAEHLCRSITKAHQALQLAELDSELMAQWWHSLQQVIEHHSSSMQVAGLCCRLLYQAGHLAADRLQIQLGKALSPAVVTAEAARFFDGFFTDAVQRLLYDIVLMTAVEQWLLQLQEEEFIEHLPLFRRVFATLDASERKRLLDSINRDRSHSQPTHQIRTEALATWPEQLQRLGKLIQRDKTWHQ
ncbi:DUF5682 family protein [Gynuella sp.]|uniref:DUF5682 family protein n=1 Tax=Gynuella sp. TaxID=2969146 RepID=UPI003D1495CF